MTSPHSPPREVRPPEPHTSSRGTSGGVRGLTGWWGVVLEAPDPHALAQFYSALLGWPIADSDSDSGTEAESESESESGTVTLNRPGETWYLAVQRAAVYTAPTWPPDEGEQGMQSHLDIEVTDLPAALSDAVALGATIAEVQPQEDVCVLLDPVGHPFCLYRAHG